MNQSRDLSNLVLFCDQRQRRREPKRLEVGVRKGSKFLNNCADGEYILVRLSGPGSSIRPGVWAWYVCRAGNLSTSLLLPLLVESAPLEGLESVGLHALSLLGR